jgi:hypothetical protein
MQRRTMCFEGGRYGRPTIQELKGQTPIRAVPDVSIDWDRLLAGLGPEPQ